MPIGIDIFSGAGGLSLGAEMAGFQVRFAVEKDFGRQVFGYTGAKSSY